MDLETLIAETSAGRGHSSRAIAPPAQHRRARTRGRTGALRFTAPQHVIVTRRGLHSRALCIGRFRSMARLFKVTITQPLSKPYCARFVSLPTLFYLRCSIPSQFETVAMGHLRHVHFLWWIGRLSFDALFLF